MPRTPVAQLGINMMLRRQPFLLREKSLTTTRSGSDLLRVVLADRSGSIPGVQFDASPYQYDALTAGQGVEVSGRVEEFRGAPQIKIEQITPTELGDLAEYLPVAHRPFEEMEQELAGFVAGVRHPALKRLLGATLGDPAIYKAFVRAPAAKFFHHACLGGLLEHTLGVARIVQAASGLYPEMNRDLAITLALLHDLGKIRAYDPTSFDLTDEGNLLGHLYLTAAMVERAMDQVEGLDDEMRRLVIHGLLAHHGRREHGSPVVPMTVEAIVTHQADMLDANARGALDHLGRAEMDTEPFTGYSDMHETRLYRGAEGAL
jgi:3'-5' exoribonuclease